MTISTIIIYYICIALSCIIMIKLYEKYTNKKMGINAKNFMKLLVISILYFFNNLFVFSIIRTITSTIIAFLMFSWIFKGSIRKNIYYTIILTLSLHFIDLLLSLFLPLGIKNIEALNQSLIFKVGFSVFVNVVYYFILSNKHIINFFNTSKSISKNNKLYYILGIIGLIYCNFWHFYVGINTSDKLQNGIVYFTELIIILLIIILSHNQYEKNLLQIKEEQLKQNTDLYAKVASEYKELKHNLMNDLLIIKTKIPKTEQNFMNEIISKYKSNYEWVNNITDIPEGLQGLVFLKKNQAEIKRITFNIEYNVTKNIEKIFSINKNFKLYETLSILFDNAIEGAEESKEKMLNVVFSFNKNNLQISILNTFNNEIDLDKIGNKNYSTKNRGSGIGLNYIKRKNNKFLIRQSIHGNIFITDIIIRHKEKK